MMMYAIVMATYALLHSEHSEQKARHVCAPRGAHVCIWVYVCIHVCIYACVSEYFLNLYPTF